VLRKGSNNAKMVKIRAQMVARIQWDLRTAKDNKGICNNVKEGYKDPEEGVVATNCEHG
jgi:hypothetical protein